MNNQLEEARFLPNDDHDKARVIINNRAKIFAGQSLMIYFGEDVLFPPTPVAIQPEQITQPVTTPVPLTVESGNVNPLAAPMTQLSPEEAKIVAIDAARAKTDRAYGEVYDEAA